MLNVTYRFIIILVAMLCFTKLVVAGEWIYFANGVRLLEEGKNIESIKEFQNALEVNPSMVEAYEQLGHVYKHKMGDFQNAKKYYLMGLCHAPNNWQLNFNLMHIYFKNENIDKAIEFYKKLSKIRFDDRGFSLPMDKLPLVVKGLCDDEKLKFYKKLLSLNPTDVTIRKRLAEFYLDNGDYLEAKGHYSLLIKYENEKLLGDAYYGMAVSNYYLEEYNSALDNLLKAKELGEYVPDEYFEMIDVKMKN